MTKKTIYNPDSNESINDRRIFGGNPDGMINFTKMKYPWALNLWDTMEANTWFPREVSMVGDAKDYKLLTINEKRMYDLVLGQLIFMDSLQTNNLMDNINPYITAPEVNACLSRQAYEEANHCYTEGTQVLTARGFVDFKEITLKDKIANWCESGNVFFKEPKEIICNDYNGEVYNYTSNNFSLEVTPEHRMVTYNIRQDNKLEINKAFEIGLNNRNIPISGFKAKGKLKSLSFRDRLRVAWQADGSLVNYTTNPTINGYSYLFRFKKERKIKEMKRLIDSAPDGELLKHTITMTECGNIPGEYYTNFYVWVPFSMDKTLEWIDVSEVTIRWGTEFMHELTKWDGCYAKENKHKPQAVRYGNTNKQAIDKITAIAPLCYMTTTLEELIPGVTPQSRLGKNKLNYYTLYIRQASTKSGRSIERETKQYKGKIYCCSVDSGMVIVKKNDQICVCGNSKSYAVMVESISENTDEIYDLWKTDTMLRMKNTFVANVYKELSNLKEEEITDRHIVLALIANQILEGLYFYAGFAAMYALGKSGKMLGSTNMIRFIQRDEVTHLLLFQNMINSVRKERPEIFTPEFEEIVRGMFRQAVEMEAQWGAYITQGQILGFTDGIILQYIQYLADKRLEAIGYKPEYNVKHPIPWVDGYASFNEQRTNFFEGNVVNYSKGSIDFDDF